MSIQHWISHRWQKGTLSPLTHLICLFLLFSGLSAYFVLSAPPTSAGNVDSGPAWDGVVRRLHVPILMYHYVSDLPPNADVYRRDLTVASDLFQAQMQYLSDNGYTTISFYDLNNALMTGAPLPDKPVILTFDDGYTDHFTNVLPVLQQHGFTGTFFIITSDPGTGSEFMTWQQIQSLANAGMSIESHTETHPDLRRHSQDFLTGELLGSLQSLQANVGRQSHILAYPFGMYDQATLTVMKTLPYWMAVTTSGGTLETTSNRLTIPRRRIHEGTTVRALSNILQDN